MVERSAQHGRRIDEEMERETAGLTHGAPIDTRAQESLEPEPTETITTPRGDPDGDPRHLEVLERSELARYLRPSALPADRDTLVAVAQAEHAPDEVMDQLRQLPDGVRFETTGQVWEALGHTVEHRPSPLPAPVAGTGEPVDAAGPGAADDVPARPTVDDRGRQGLPEVAPPHPARDALVFGLDVARGIVGLADRVLARVQRALGG